MGQRWIAVAIGATACVGAGLFAGADAAGHVDAFYTAPRVHPERAPPMPESSPYDWDRPLASSTTWASATQGQSVAILGDGRGDGSDLTEMDRAVERAGAVRVHRSRPARVEREVSDLPPVEDLPALDEALADDPTA